jgi:hypothetical protein
MVDPDRDPDDPDSAVHDALVDLLEAVKLAALPEAGGPLDTTVLNFPRATVYAIVAVGLLLDKRLAMNERNRG